MTPHTASLDQDLIRALVGTDDEPGILDRFQVKAVDMPTGKPLVFWYCERDCGAEGNGYVQIIARDLDGNQTGLTLGELVESALRHESEEHPASTSAEAVSGAIS